MNPIRNKYNRKGILAETTTFFYRNDLNILECRQYTDVREGVYYMRIAVDLSADVTRGGLENRFRELAEKLDLTWAVYYSEDQQNVAVLVSCRSCRRRGRPCSSATPCRPARRCR